MSERIEIPEEQAVEKFRCSISISESSIWIDFRPALPQGPHKVTRTEVMAAAALVGIARTLTGRGEAEVMAAIGRFDSATKGRKK